MAWRLGQPLRLATESYVLRSMRPFQVDDEVLRWLGDRELMQYAAFPDLSTRQRVLHWINHFDNKQSFIVSITCKQTDRLIGLQTFYFNVRLSLGKADVVLGDRTYWGRGAVLETRARIMDFLFYRLRVHKMHGRVMARNLPAIYNYKKLGFRCEGVLKEQELALDGQRCDLYCFGLLRTEWDRIRKDKN